MISNLQRGMMRHALGLDRSKNAYRNRYNAGTTAAEDAWLDLCGRGLAGVARRGQYHVTRAGFALVVEPGETFDHETFDDL